MDLSEIFNLTGKKIADIAIFGVVISGLLIGAFYAAGLIRFMFDASDMVYMLVAVAIGFVASFVLNRKFGRSGSPAEPKPQPQPPQPGPVPQQPAPVQAKKR